MTDPNKSVPSGSTRKADSVKLVPKATFLGRMRAYFFAGVLITAPISISLYLAWLLINFVDDTVTPLIPIKYNPETYLPFALPGLGIVVLVFALTLTGALTAGFVGRFFIRFSEQMLSRMPVVRSVYNAVKQILETVLAQQSKAFREAVLVEYPRRGLWAIAFITGTTEGEVQHLTEEETINIFLPTTPNPTSGFLLFVPKADLIRLDMSVEEAIKMVISGGIVTPPDRRPEKLRAQAMTSARIYENVDVLREAQNAPISLAAKRPGEVQDEIEHAAGIERGEVDIADRNTDDKK